MVVAVPVSAVVSVPPAVVAAVPPPQAAAKRAKAARTANNRNFMDSPRLGPAHTGADGDWYITEVTSL